MNYLEESYGGSKTNPHLNKCFYCYTVFDIDRNKYYSGYKTNKNSNLPCIGITYFTSSTVVDFKERFKQQPHRFQTMYEFFETAKAAALAEKAFHKKHNVGKSNMFYNAVNSGGSTCGTGTVLCKNEAGLIYRVSSEEYKTGKHRSVNCGKMNAVIKSTGEIIKIDKTEFDPDIMLSQFKNHILCFDKQLGKRRRVARLEYENHPNRYVGSTKGTFTVLEKSTGKKVTLPAGTIYDKSLYQNKGIPNTIKVIDSNNNIVNIPRENYDKHSGKYKHYNSTYLNRIDIETMTKRKVLREEYDLNPNNFADLNAKFYYIVSNKKFGSWRKLTAYYNIGRYVSLKNAEKLIKQTIQKVDLTINEN